jgi:hypothetical protein
MRFLTGDHEDHFLHAPQVGRAGIHRLDLPTAVLGIATVHAQQVRGEERAFSAPRASPDFQDGVAGIRGVRGNDAPLNRRRETRFFGLQPLHLFGRHDCHLGASRFRRQELTVFDKIPVDLQPGVPIGHKLPQARMLPGQLLPSGRIAEGVRSTEECFHLVKAAAELLDERQEIHDGTDFVERVPEANRGKANRPRVVLGDRRAVVGSAATSSSFCRQHPP